eukprot:symbB.v1.2.010227.t1/scaffold667.1/size175007/10
MTARTHGDSWGLPQGSISTSARALAKLRRRLSGVWSVSFDIETPADEEAKVKESLMQLKNSETFASKLKEELRFRGADPVADFKVSLDLVDDEEAGAGNDATQTIIIVAAVAAGLIMLGVVVWKVCSGGPRESNEPLKEKEESTRLDSTDGSGSVADNQYSHAPDTAVHPLEPTYLGVSSGYPRDVDDHGFYPASVVPEREFSEPPLPPPAESPPTRSLWSEVGETVAQEPANPIKLADVNPDISKRPPPLTEWTLVDHQLNQAACQALSPSSWTGSLIWTELPQVRHATPLPLNKEYKLNFQRAGRLAGHCNDASSQYKITGKHRESGELTWREVPQSSTGMAIECQGRLQIRELRGGAAKCECFEIVGVFTAVSTSISARHLGSGRFKLTTSVQPTAFGNRIQRLANPAESCSLCSSLRQCLDSPWQWPFGELLQEEDSRSNFETPSPGAASSSRNQTPTNVSTDRTRRPRSANLGLITASHALTRLRGARGSETTGVRRQV